MKKKGYIIFLRCVLAVLIVANMAVIFAFSAQDSKESSDTSGKVTEIVATIVVKDFESKTEAEKSEIIWKIHPPTRKAAHMMEFGCLGALILLLLLTWDSMPFLRYLLSLALTFLYACTDEIHQMSIDLRGPAVSDALIDLSGALISCTVLFLLAMLVKKARKKKGAKHAAHTL